MIIDSPIISGSYAATGSLNQTGNVVITGSLTVTGTINGSITGSITTASYALNAEALDGLDSTSFTTTSSFTAYTSSTDASILSNTQNIVVLNASASSLDSRVTRTEATASSLTTASSSFSTRVTSNESNISSLQTASGSFSTRTTNLETASGSFSTRVTSTEGSVSSLNSKTGSYATTSSNAFSGSQTITGSLTVTGQITAQTLNVQQVTSSIVFSSGSNIFGNSVSNTQQFTGSLQVSGSNHYLLGNVGIGTVSSVFKLDIFGGQTRISGSANEQLVLDYAASSGGFTWQSFRLNGTNKYRLVGNIDNSFGIYSDILSAYALTISSTNAATFANALQVAGQQAAANYGGTGLNFDFTSGNIGRIASVKTTSGGSQLQFFVYNTSGTDVNALQINSTGNVGIGTTSPATKLHISNNGAYGIEIDVANEIIQAYNRSTSDYNEIKLYSSNIRFFNGTSSTITERMRITSGGLVGVGTTSPLAKLHLRDGAFAIYQTSGSGVSSLGGQIYLGDTNFDNSSYFNSAPGIGAVYSSDTSVAGDLAFYVYTGVSNNRTERMRILQNGFVGIGTTSPSEKLSITSGNIQISAGYKLQYSSTAYITPEDNTNGARIVTPGALNIATGGTSVRMTVDGNGYVGIGTTSPSGKLHVIADGSGNTNTNIIGSQLILSRTTGATENTAFRNTGASNGISGTSYAAQIISDGNNVLEMFTTSAIPLIFGTNASERMRINQYGQLLINATSSAYSANLFGYNLGVRGTNNQTFISIARANQTLDSQGIIIGLDTTQAMMTVHDNIPLAFSTNATERMRITSGGNVGIGTTSPSEILHLRDTTNGYTGLRLEGNGSYAGSDWTIYASSLSAPSADDFLGFYNNSTTDGATAEYKFRLFKTGAATFSSSVTAGGDILINNSGETIANIRATSSQGGLSLWSGATADYNGGAGITLVSSDRSGAYTRGELYISAGRATNNTANGFIWFGTSDTERMRITSGGNVGIGTTSPSEKLEVNGSIRLSDGNADGPQVKLASSGYSDWNLDNFSGNFRAYYGSTEIMRITSGGNVGIGLTNPLATLATLGGAVQFMGDYRNYATIIKSAGANGTFNGQLTITIPQMSNAASDGYGGYSCEVYVSGFSGIYCHVWFSGYINGGITPGEATILRSNGGWSISQSSYGANNQGFQFVVNYPDALIHPTARIIFNKGGSPNATAYPANEITAVWS